MCQQITIKVLSTIIKLMSIEYHKGAVNGVSQYKGAVKRVSIIKMLSTDYYNIKVLST